jgi:hypothetical protein
VSFGSVASTRWTTSSSPRHAQQTDAGILVKTEMWQLTPNGLERVLADACSDGDIDVRGYWSLRVAVAFLMFLAGGGLDEP